jgi:DNA-binding MarR family transcriptional regulator
MKNIHEHHEPSIGRVIGRLSRAAHSYLQYRFGEIGLGHAQGLTLHFICRHDGIDQMELLKKVHLDKSSLTSQLKKMEENGYIKRKTDPEDRRAKRIVMTNKTRIIQDDLHDIFISWSKILLDGLDENERETAFRLLDKMQVNASSATHIMRDHETTE